jgi:7-cyano-7-deazaguanine synthase in queuosine biosynthesis
MNAPAKFLELEEMAVDVLENGMRTSRGATACVLDRNITFDTEALESFSSRNWQAIIYDALVVAAAVEFCDRSLKRSTMNWGRLFNVRIPVHDVAHWSNPAVVHSLIDALTFLTGDDWRFKFVERHKPAPSPIQKRIEFPYDSDAVIAYSDGLDSRAVWGLESKRLGNRLVRVRVGSADSDVPKKGRAKEPFAALPYAVKLDAKGRETTARSRGFKFSVVAAIGAYLINAPTVIVPESGQGALAPAILPVGQSYPDYRNHPAFSEKMERFVKGLLDRPLRYQFPRIWATKGETLRAFIDSCDPDGSSWRPTRSCWQQSRHASVSGSRRQCGICAACMLRRLSVHAAREREPKENYVWETLDDSTFEGGAAPGFAHVTGALREYALAGVLHLEHFASLRSSQQYALVKRGLGDLAQPLGMSPEAVIEAFDRLLDQHGKEWAAFTNELGSESFVRKWIDTAS